MTKHTCGNKSAAVSLNVRLVHCLFLHAARCDIYWFITEMKVESRTIYCHSLIVLTYGLWNKYHINSCYWLYAGQPYLVCLNTCNDISLVCVTQTIMASTTPCRLSGDKNRKEMFKTHTTYMQAILGYYWYKFDHSAHVYAWLREI